MRSASFVCSTTVRNESWILPRFLACTNVWAEQIVVVNDQSTDASRVIAAADPKVTIVDFHRPSELRVNEAERWRARLGAARELPLRGRRIIFALDADEVLSANHASDLARIAQASPGTVITARWANLLPGLDRCWISEERCAFGYVDDGGEFTPSGDMHVRRVPPGPELHLENTVLLHYKFVASARAKARIRLYQVRETVDRARGALDQFRLYRRGVQPDPMRVRPVDPAWFKGYERAGIDMRTIADGDDPYIATLTLELIDRYGANTFRRADIWDVDWNAVAAAAGKRLTRPIKDPRGPWTRLVHTWLSTTQNHRRKLTTRIGERVLRASGW